MDGGVNQLPVAKYICIANTLPKSVALLKDNANTSKGKARPCKVWKHSHWIALLDHTMVLLSS